MLSHRYISDRFPLPDKAITSFDMPRPRLRSRSTLPPVSSTSPIGAAPLEIELAAMAQAPKP